MWFPLTRREESWPADAEPSLSRRWKAGAFHVFRALQCMRRVSQGHISSTPPPPTSRNSHSNVSINCRAVTNGVQLTGNTLALTVKPCLLMDVIRKVQPLPTLSHTTPALSTSMPTRPTGFYLRTYVMQHRLFHCFLTVNFHLLEFWNWDHFRKWT